MSAITQKLRRIVGAGDAGDDEGGGPVQAVWKGTVIAQSDRTVKLEGNPAAAWSYPSPSPAAAQIKGHIAFWHGVKVGRAARG